MGRARRIPQFRTTRLYTWLTATEVRRQLLAQKAIRMRNCRPPKPLDPSSISWDIPRKKWPRASPKKTPETNANFAQVKQRTEEADEASQVLRLSIDAKATVRVGPFARGGKSRVPTRAADHDFTPVATVTPVGIFLPASDELFLFGVTSKVTSDCLVDRLIDWWESVKERFSHITTLLINLDNGPESHSRRTQFMQCLVEFAQRSHLSIRLA